jgi:hypothetical protein
MTSRSLIRTLAASGLVFGTALACSDVLQVPSVARDPNDALIQKIVELGFRPDMILDRGTYFLVEGDIAITKQELRQRMAADSLVDRGRSQRVKPGDKALRGAPPRARFQWMTYGLVSLGIAPQIRVDVSGAESSWQTALLEAIAEWNNVNPQAIINLVSGSPADITVSMTNNLPFTDCGNFTVARADFPNGTNPGPTIQISNQVTNLCGLSSSQKKYNMAHELGHTLGLRHTNWMARNEDENPDGAIRIPNTPFTDAASVMNGGTALNSWNGFSAYDQIAAFQLYPPPITVSGGISGPTSVSRNTPSTWSVATASGGTGEYGYAWEVQCLLGEEFDFLTAVNTLSITPGDYCAVEGRMLLRASAVSGARTAPYAGGFGVTLQ